MNKGKNKNTFPQKEKIFLHKKNVDERGQTN